MRTAVLITIVAVGLALTGCDEPSRNGSGGKNAPQTQPKARTAAVMSMAAPRLMADEMASRPAGPRMQVGRHYAFEISQGSVAEAMEKDRAYCLQLGCTVTAVNTSNDFAHPRASLSALVPQDKAADFHAYVSGTQGRAVTSFQETAQNRDEQYRDIQARLERLVYMRKRLYALADQKSKNIGELLQVERELMRVETDIERITRDRSGLEKVTDNVAFDLSYSERPPKAGDVDFSPFTGLMSDIANTIIYGVRVTLLWLARWFPAAILVLGAAYLLRRRLNKNTDQS